MNTIDASLRNTKTSGEVNKLRSEGNVPGIVYGGKSETQKISISKKLLKNLIEKENFLSSILNLKILIICSELYFASRPTILLKFSDFIST